LCYELVKKQILEVKENAQTDAFDENEYNFRLYAEPTASQIKCLWCLCIINEICTFKGHGWLGNNTAIKELIDSLAEKWHIDSGTVSAMEDAVSEDDTFSLYGDWKAKEKNKFFAGSDGICESWHKVAEGSDEDLVDGKSLQNWFEMNALGLLGLLVAFLAFAEDAVSIKEKFERNSFFRKFTNLFSSNLSKWGDRQTYLTSPLFAKSAFLFLLCDGKVTREKYAAFDGLGASLPSFDKIRGEAVNDTLTQVFKGGIGNLNMESRFKIVKTELSSIAKSEMSVWGGKPSSSALLFIWYLALVAFYFDKPSQSKITLIKILAKEWDITGDVLSEMCDTAETFASIRDRRARLVSQKNNERQLIELHKNWLDLNQSILFLINEKKKSDDEKVISKNTNAYDDEDTDVEHGNEFDDWIECESATTTAT
jgi:hypothetical protein